LSRSTASAQPPGKQRITSRKLLAGQISPKPSSFVICHPPSTDYQQTSGGADAFVCVLASFPGPQPRAQLSAGLLPDAVSGSLGKGRFCLWASSLWPEPGLAEAPCVQITLTERPAPMAEEPCPPASHRCLLATACCAARRRRSPRRPRCRAPLPASSPRPPGF